MAKPGMGKRAAGEAVLAGITWEDLRGLLERATWDDGQPSRVNKQFSLAWAHKTYSTCVLGKSGTVDVWCYRHEREMHTSGFAIARNILRDFG